MHAAAASIQRRICHSFAKVQRQQWINGFDDALVILLICIKLQNGHPVSWSMMKLLRQHLCKKLVESAKKKSISLIHLTEGNLGWGFKRHFKRHPSYSAVMLLPVCYVVIVIRHLSLCYSLLEDTLLLLCFMTVKLPCGAAAQKKRHQGPLVSRQKYLKGLEKAAPPNNHSF